MTYLDRDLSWLSFNERVLEEARKPEVPLLERLKFLAIYSSNLDEFYRVRVATIRRALSVEDQLDTDEMLYPPSELLRRIQADVSRQLDVFGTAFRQVLDSLQEQGVHLYRGVEVDTDHTPNIRHYFRSEVLSFLQPVITEANRTYFLENRQLYLLFLLEQNTAGTPVAGNPAAGTPAADDATHTVQRLAYVNIPADELGRFYQIDKAEGQQHFITLDDIIRLNYQLLFPGYRQVDSYSVLVNRDADLGIEDEYAGDLIERIKDRVKKRERGSTVRFLYDTALPQDLLPLVQEVFEINPYDLVQGGRYHRMKDLFSLPVPDKSELQYPPQPPIHTKTVFGDDDATLYETLAKQDVLLHFPYHSYDYILQFFNEAAIDPDVTAIQATFYRIAEDSRIANALVSAARNGKQVTVFMEVKARFDEQNNLQWSEALEAAGARVHYSRPELKVHAKAALVKRQGRDGTEERYGILATGNFNEDTARLYSDMALLTAHAEMTKDLSAFFRCLFNDEPTPPLTHLLVSPYDLQQQFIEKIEREIRAAQRGETAKMIIKVNNLEDHVMIDKLYEASQAGVEVLLFVRSVCCLTPGIPGQSEGLHVVRLVDRYLEHVRAFYFYNGGQEEIYLASADWMRRNLYSRIELAFPILDTSLRAQVMQILSFHQQDNTQAVHFTADYQNKTLQNDEAKVRAQYETYRWLKEQEERRA